MRRFSLKRQKLNREAAQWRAERILEIGVCDICGIRPCELIHEIARGIHRVNALMAPFAQLGPCNTCHDQSLHKGMSIAEQLAWLYHRRPLDFDLEKFWKLIDRRHPSYSEVMTIVKRLRWQEDERRGF